MEELVLEKVDEYLKVHPEICKCQHCRLDIAALVLNNFPPKYVVTEEGENYSRLSALASQFRVDLVTALIQASSEVMQNPRHDKR
ncbi:MAG: late competence development ComFB family protein [Candidatus Wallbacteria bacterium]|nr:late competence development ComFB family protein [Candidatus Wallbacteria bacterium]